MAQKQENKYTFEEYDRIIAGYHKMSDEELLDIVRQKAAELGRIPKKGEIPAFHVLKHRFGPWPRVLEAAGVKEVSEVYLRRTAAREERRRTRHQAYKQRKRQQKCNG